MLMSGLCCDADREIFIALIVAWPAAARKSQIQLIETFAGLIRCRKGPVSAKSSLYCITSKNQFTLPKYISMIQENAMNSENRAVCAIQTQPRS